MQCSNLFRPALTVPLLLACAAQAQTPPSAQPPAKAPVEQRTEVITHEDAGSRIDELRVGGQTKRIDVQTKTSVPAYQVQPVDANSPADGQGTAGKSSWRVLKF
jgi:hypothetical protein